MASQIINTDSLNIDVSVPVKKSGRCEHDTCNKYACFNLAGEPKGRYCNTHKEVGMINIVSKRCEIPIVINNLSITLKVILSLNIVTLINKMV
jgi:hypothetical protein